MDGVRDWRSSPAGTPATSRPNSFQGLRWVRRSEVAGSNQHGIQRHRLVCDAMPLLPAAGDGAQRVTAMFQRIAGTPRREGAHGPGELLAAGQFDVALSVYTQSIGRLTDKGASGFLRRRHRPHRQSVVVPLRRRWRHAGHRPSAGATLYLDFQLSPDGAAVDQKLRALPPLPLPTAVRPCAHDPVLRSADDDDAARTRREPLIRTATTLGVGPEAQSFLRGIRSAAPSISCCNAGSLGLRHIRRCPLSVRHGEDA